MHFTKNLIHAFDMMKTNAPYMLMLISTLWGIQLLNWGLKYRLNILGIYPRKFFGLIGIIFSPLLHGNFQHLFLNSIPLFILGSFIMIYGKIIFWMVTIIVALTSGFLVWLFARSAFHVGCSGIIMGYFGFLLANAYNHASAIAIISAVVCLFYLGSLLYGMIPQKGQASWEAHLFGFLAGIISNFVI